jgi:hypothetical protein
LARIRTIKPEFFRHELLQDLEQQHPGKYPMLVFAGLFGHCDKAGRFEWRPRTLKLDILPFLAFEMADTLALLETAKLVRKYTVDGVEYGEIPTFTEHQRVSGKEAQEPEKHPAPTREAKGKKRGSTREAPETAGREGKGKEEEGKGTEARFALPGWIPAEPWQAWLKARKARSNTPEAIALAVKKLEQFKAGGMDPQAVLEQSIVNGWQGLFPLRGTVNGAPGKQAQLEDRNRAAGAEWLARKEEEERLEAERQAKIH